MASALYNVALLALRAKIEARNPGHVFDLTCFDEVYNIQIAHKYNDTDLANEDRMNLIHMNLFVSYSYAKWLPFFNVY